MQTELVEFLTQDQYQMQGAWVGPTRPKRVFIFIHGLTSNLFSGKKIFPLVDKDTAVLTYNNAGHDVVARLKVINPQNPKGYDSDTGGTALEVFEDCVDDLEGAVTFAKSRTKEVYLVGHSTGCQKSIFYLAKTKNKQGVKGVVLLCPLSDYAYVASLEDRSQYNKALAFAQAEVEAERPNTLLTEQYWFELLSAQRFLSLYTPESSEELFCYSQNGKNPTTYQSIVTPTLVILAGADEYSDRAAEKLKEWFDQNNKSSKYKSIIIPDAIHNLKDAEDQVCKGIVEWVNS